MYPITTAGLAALREDVVQSVNILCTPTKGTAFNITDKDIIGAVTVDWSSVTGSKLDLGSACMSELSFTLENTDSAFDDKVFEGAQLYVTTSFPTGSATETVPIGYYTVDSPPRKLRSIKITAYDRMAKFNRTYDTELAYPATLYQIIADACTKCGVSQKLPTNTLHRGVSIPKRPEADNLTYRQVLVWAAELMGVSLYIDYDGKLTGGWYATNAKHTVIKASDRFTSGNTDFAENNIVFSGVRIVGNDENKTEYLAGTKDYAFNIEGNLLAQSDMNLSTLATELKTARCSLTYTPMSCTTHSFPHLRPLNVMNFETAQGTKKVVLTNVKWQSQNRCTKLEGKGETATQSGYATMGAFTPKQQAVLEQTRAQQAAQINDYEQATLALNETIANSMGLYVTRKVDSSGAVITYYHDMPTLEGSNTIYCRNAGGYAWTNNGWNNGSPNWEYGVSKDGDAVIRSIAANKISASYITTDILSSPTGKFSFNLDTGHISASDIDISGGSINLQGASEQTYYTQLTSNNASSLGWKSASEYAAEDEHKPYITADWLTPTNYPTTGSYYQAGSQWYNCKKGDVFHLTGEGYNRAYDTGESAWLDVIPWVQVMCKSDADGSIAMVSLCATTIPPSFGSTRATTIDTTGTLYCPGYTPVYWRICIATHRQNSYVDRPVGTGWYAFHNLEVSRTTTEGGSFTVAGSNGYIADLSSGVLRLSYKSGDDTQQFFDMANTRCYSSKDDYKWYATMATQDYTLSGKTSAGFKFGSSNEDTRSYIPTDPTDGNSSLPHEWNTTYARIEKDTTYIRRRIHVNEHCYATDPQEYLSFRASGTNAGNDFTTDFGAAITAAGGSYPAFAVRVRGSNGNDYVRADLFAGNTDRAEVQLYDSQGRKYRVTFKQDKIMFWSETLGTKTINFV